ncbi:MAG: hypothetical protein CVV02_00240 [Firmicutes bacterium HGW-Firmicutes-7]|nr:MAG: hypothetical protein CVV02_00240 [Firmicutes bacterium HGW-Firmicutes-7]
MLSPHRKIAVDEIEGIRMKKMDKILKEWIEAFWKEFLNLRIYKYLLTSHGFFDIIINFIDFYRGKCYTIKEMRWLHDCEGRNFIG